VPERGGVLAVMHKLACWVLPEHITGAPE